MIKSILKQKHDSFICFINMNEYNSLIDEKSLEI